jgi:hypothetical protein
VRVNGHVSGKALKKHREFAMAAGEMSEDEFTQFLNGAFSLMTAHSADGATFYACMDWRNILEIFKAIQALDCELLSLCVWVKTNGGMGSLYRSRHELVFVFAKGGAKRVNNEVIAGLVERVTFHNDENGFCVLRVKARGKRDLITVVGHAATISAGVASRGFPTALSHGR